MKLIKFLIIISIFSFTLFSCTDLEEQQSAEPVNTKLVPDQESWSATITITNNANRVAEVWAGYIAFYKETNETFLRDSIHIDFYNREGQHNSILIADSGIVYNSTNNLEAMGNVVVNSDSGVVLETSKLRWDNKIQKIVSEVPVKFTTATDTVFGDSFISDATLTNYEIENARGYTKRKLPTRK